MHYLFALSITCKILLDSNVNIKNVFLVFSINYIKQLLNNKH